VHWIVCSSKVKKLAPTCVTCNCKWLVVGGWGDVGANRALTLITTMVKNVF